jgi:hypothetical protein
VKRYTLKAGRILSDGEFVAIGTVLTLCDDEAARLRLGGCTLEPAPEPAPEPQPAKTGASGAKVKPTPKRRRGRSRKAPATSEG